MTTAREFWTVKSPLAEYHAIKFDHPAFDAPFRLVINQYAEVTLGGNVHTPVQGEVKPPEQKSDAQPRLMIGFPRQVVGRQFKQQLRLVKASGSREPISVTYEVYLGATDTPKLSWSLYVAEQGGIQFSTDTVQVTATTDNPMRRQVAPVYDPTVFTGLEILR